MKYPDVTAGQTEAAINILGGWERFLQLLRGELIVKAAELLRRVTEVAVGDVKRFVAKNHLKEANIVWMGDNFKRLFLNNIEENVEAVTLTIHRLEKSSLDAPILAELGDRAQTSLVHFFELLKKQSKGESGLLLTNGYANIAYIIGDDGNLWAVYAGWHGDGWYLNAYSVDVPHEWYSGYQVLSR